MKQCKIDGCQSTDLASRSAMCKEHHREYVREHYNNNRGAYLAKAERHRADNKAIVRRAKDTPCMDCGNSYPYYVMDFDHREHKEFTLGHYGTMGRKQILSEIDKCDVVCSNCHRIRTAARAGYAV